MSIKHISSCYPLYYSSRKQLFPHQQVHKTKTPHVILEKPLCPENHIQYQNKINIKS